MVFPAGAKNLTNQDDLPANTSINGITIQASGYNISGNAVDLGGGIIASYVSGSSTIALDLNPTYGSVLSASTSPKGLDFTGVV